MSCNYQRENAWTGKSGIWTVVISGLIVIGFSILMVLVLVTLCTFHVSGEQATWTDEATGVTYFVTENGNICPRYQADGSLYLAP